MGETILQCIIMEVTLLILVVYMLFLIGFDSRTAKSFYNTCTEEEVSANYGSTAPELEKNFIYNEEK